MKKVDLERKLKEMGFTLSHGGSHDMWVRGKEKIPVPRHREINEDLAKAILKKAMAKK